MQTKPNILVFMTDQQRGDSVSDTRILMPNTRKLMAEGLAFTESYCPAPHCCPSRATFFTGQYPTQHGVWNNVCVQNTLSRRLNPETELFSHHLKKQGYQSFFAGKWHVCYDTGPEDHGFEELYVTCNKESKNDPSNKAMSPDWEMYKRISSAAHKRKNGEILRPGYPDYVHYGVTENPFNDEDVVNSALDKLKTLRQADDPWMMYIGTLGPHDPYFVPQAFLDLYQDVEVELTDIHHDSMDKQPAYNRKVRRLFDQLSIEEKKQAIKHYWAFCTYEDHLIGRVIDELKQHDKFDNTLILLTSDHGDYNGEHGLWCKGLPAYKGAYHIPTIVHWPVGIKQPGRTLSDLISLADIAPTFLDILNCTMSQPIVGKSLLPYFNNENIPPTHSYLHTQTNGNEIYGIQRTVFNKEWKLVFNTFDNDELYDLTKDPDELINLIDDPDSIPIIKTLYQELWRFAEKTNDSIINPYILVGLAKFGPGIL
ncbi:sulfatase-like hydrolase/transferase [Marinomonas arenicola]|uniref:Sulfatase-like hydrolase/transferase n=1 Tax=Marinomonas arenicola TaxID=569601 RepID=A0ABU9G5H5_9GAMM